MIAKTLEGRLLCACNASYGDIEHYGSMAGFSSPPAVISTSDGVNSALVATTVDGVVVAFRGTLAIDDATQPFVTRLHDWIDDFTCDLFIDVSIPGCVHAGFLAAVNSLWPQVKQELIKQWRPGMKVFVTGHSKGGGMAPLAAYRWYSEIGLPLPSVVTFAAPKSGDTTFQAAWKGTDISMTRYEFQSDIVPHVPPSPKLLIALQNFAGGEQKDPFTAAEYRAVGDLRFMHWDRQVHQPVGTFDSFLLEVDRIVRIGELFVARNIDEIVEAHHIIDGSGYFKWLCPEYGVSHDEANLGTV